MGQIEDFRMFITIVDNGGITRAADNLGIAKSAVSRRLERLETRYDVRLINRSSRNWKVTTAGRELYQRATATVADADEIDADFMHLSQSLRGPLSITIAREFGLSYLQPMLFNFIKDYPEIDLTIDFDDRIIDLDSENYDLAVRITTDGNRGMVTERLGRTRHGLFASPVYLEENGYPEHPDQLREHKLLHYGNARRATWKFHFKKKQYRVDFQPALNSNCGPFLLTSALNGLGIIQLPEFIVAKSVKDELLKPVLPEVDISEYSINVTYSASRRVNKRMRAFIDALTDSCCVLDR